MHMDTRVIEVADFRSEVKLELWGHWGHLKAVMASEATIITVMWIIHMATRVIGVADFKFEVKLSLWGHIEAIEVSSQLA